MKRVNWKLLISDLFAVLALVWLISKWPVKDNFYRFGAIIGMITVVVWRIDAHFTYYRKERKWF